MWALSAAVLFTTACNETEEPQPQPQPETKLELSFSVGEVTSSTITYTITPNNDDATYFAQLYAAEELAEERDIAMKAALMTMEQAYTGKQTLTAEELNAESQYKVLYFGYNAEEKRYTTDYLVSDAITTADFEINETLEVAYVESSATWRDAWVDIKPSNNELEYVFDFMEKSKWEELYGENPEAIVAERIRLWELDVESGLEFYPELDTWQKYMQLYQQNGTQTINVSEYYNLRWGTEYVVYAFGMNDEGYQTTSVVTAEFATTTPETSANTLSIALGEVTESSVAFTVNASNDDPYFVSIQDKRYVERFGEGKEESWEDMIWDLTYGKTDDQIASYIFNGTQELTNESINKNIDTLHEYQILVWGFNDGPTTEVYVSEAFQPQAAVREVKLWLEVLDVTHESVTCNVEVNYDDATYYAACITKEQFGDDYGATYFYEAMANVTANLLYTGTQDITFEGLNPESEYYVVAFGYDAELAEASTFLEYKDVRTMPIPSDGLFTISVSDITWRDAIVSVATELEAGYIFGVYTAEEFATTTPEAILEKRIATWQSNAEWYTDTTWQDMMAYDLKYGNKSIYVKDDIQKLRWATDYVFYCMAMDAEGNAVSQMATAEFSTVTPTPSDCTFDITIDSMTKSSVNFTVTPSNPDEQYYVTVQKASVVAPYGPDQEKSYDDLIAYLIPDYDNQIEQRLFTGEQSISNSQLSNSVNGFYEYVIVVWGFDNGPTTTVFMSEAFKPTDQ